MQKRDLIKFTLNPEDEYNIIGEFVSKFGLDILTKRYEIEFLQTDVPIIEIEPGYFSFKIKLSEEKREAMKLRLLQISEGMNQNSLTIPPINLN